MDNIDNYVEDVYSSIGSFQAVSVSPVGSIQEQDVDDSNSSLDSVGDALDASEVSDFPSLKPWDLIHDRGSHENGMDGEDEEDEEEDEDEDDEDDEVVIDLNNIDKEYGTEDEATRAIVHLCRCKGFDVAIISTNKDNLGIRNKRLACWCWGKPRNVTRQRVRNTSTKRCDCPWRAYIYRTISISESAEYVYRIRITNPSHNDHEFVPMRSKR